MSSAALPRRGLSLAAPLTLAAVVCALALVAPSLASAEREVAEAPRLLLPRSGVVHAGEQIELRWAGDVSEVDELEIMLTIDRPERRTLQVSPELDPVRGVFVWRVPEIGRASGRFRVRYNRDGHEVEGAPSARFELLSSVAAPMAPLLQPEGGATGFPVSGGSASSGARTEEGESSTDAGLSGRARRASELITDAAGGAVSMTIAAVRSRPTGGPERFPARN